ncbi:MAG: histidine kinase dimerization/phospho-acceptor domain-containing protein [Candidatus Omnitrophota bacterium]
MKKESLLRFLFILIGASLVILITVFDRQMSPHPALVIYYLIPVSLVTWFSGPVAGLCLALLSVWGWFNNGMFHIRSLFHYELFFYLHVTFRILFLLAAVYVMNRLKKSLKKEKELSERKTYFVARVSHELNNPLTIIRGSLEFVLNGLAGGINPQ